MDVAGAGFTGPIDLRIGPSRALARISAIVHAVFALCLYLHFDGSAWSICLSGSASLLGARSVYRYLRPGCSRVRWSPRGEWWVEQPQACRAELIDAPLVRPELTVLRLRLASGSRVRLVLAEDNVDADAFRRLRVRLRYR